MVWTPAETRAIDRIEKGIDKLHEKYDEHTKDFQCLERRVDKVEVRSQLNHKDIQTLKKKAQNQNNNPINKVMNGEEIPWKKLIIALVTLTIVIATAIITGVVG